jgi:phage host-nuclease inhibitor protein Gam
MTAITETIPTAETIPTEHFSSYPVPEQPASQPPHPQAPEDYRPDAAGLVLQLEQIPENASEALNELHDFHILTKEMKRVLNDFTVEAADKYTNRITAMAELLNSVEPRLSGRVSLAEKWTTKLESLAAAQYKELYLVRKLRADMEPYVQANIPLQRELDRLEAEIDVKEAALGETNASYQTAQTQCQTFERQKYELETAAILPTPENDEPAAPQKMQAAETNEQKQTEQLDVAIRRLDEIMGEKAREFTAINTAINTLTDEKAGRLAEMASNNQAIAMYWGKINRCLAVVQENAKQHEKLYGFEEFAQTDRASLLDVAFKLQQQTEPLMRQHEFLLGSEEYTAHEYLEADVSELTSGIKAPVEDGNQLEARLAEVTIFESGLFATELDEATRQTAEERIARDMFTLTPQGQEQELKATKVAFRPIPEYVKHAEPNLSQPWETGFETLETMRNDAIRSRGFLQQYQPNEDIVTIPRRLQEAVRANGSLLLQQYQEFNRQAEAIRLGLDEADSLLFAAKPMQLTFEQVTHDYTAYRRAQDPIVNALTERTRQNMQDTAKARTAQVTLQGLLVSLASDIETFTATASRLLADAVADTNTPIVAQNRKNQADLMSRIENGEENREYAMAEFEAQYTYARGSAGEVVLPPEHTEAVGNLEQAKQDLTQTYKQLAETVIALKGTEAAEAFVTPDARLKDELNRQLEARNGKKYEGLESAGTRLRTEHARELEAHRHEIGRFTSFATATQAKLEESRSSAIDQLGLATSWLANNGKTIVIDKEAVKAAMNKAANAQAQEPEDSKDWRAAVHMPKEQARKRVERAARAFLGSLSVRFSFKK